MNNVTRIVTTTVTIVTLSILLTANHIYCATQRDNTNTQKVYVEKVLYDNQSQRL